MRTKADAQAYFLNCIDESTKKGVELAPTKNADYRVKFNQFLDSAQKYVAGFIKIPEVFQITQNHIPNMQGLMQGFDIVQILDTDKVYEFTGCKALYFEVDNVATITVAVNNVITQTINNTIKGKFMAYKILTGASSADIVKVTFTALYPYNIRNTGFYAYAFPLAIDIPTYAPYTTYDMPVDFLEFDSVIIKSDPRIYQSYIAHKWENNKKIVLNYYDTGSFDIHYYRYPAYIAPDALDTTVLDIEEKAFELVCLQCAIMATAADNVSLSSWLRSLYVEKASNVSQQDQPIINSIQTVFSMC
jgi:hypothetical protein